MDEKKRRGNLLLALAFAFFLACFSFASVETADARRGSCKACGGPVGNMTCYDVSIGDNYCGSWSSGSCEDGGGDCPSPE